MKTIRNILIFLCITVLFINSSISASATNTVFTTEAMSDDEISDFFSYADICMLSYEPEKDSIDCFAVNENNMIALGFSDHNDKTVCIYTSEGAFLYGYKFKCMGSFCVDWDKNNTIVYTVRGDKGFVLTEKGDVTDVFRIQNTSENHRYWNNYITLSECTVGDNEYSLRNDMGILNFIASSYSQLVLTRSDGSETIIYDANQKQIQKYIIDFLLALFVFSITLLSIIFSKKNSKKAQSQNTQQYNL